MLEQPLPMSSALRASARSLGFLMGYINWRKKMTRKITTYACCWVWTRLSIQTIMALTMSFWLFFKARTALARDTLACDITSSMSFASMPLSSTYVKHTHIQHASHFPLHYSFHDFAREKLFYDFFVTWKHLSFAEKTTTFRHKVRVKFWNWGEATSQGVISGTAGHGNTAVACSLCVHRYNQWLVRIHMQIHVNQRPHWTLRQK